jgi:hypothetical protein
MRKLAEDIAGASNSSELEKTMSSYALWLGGQSQGRQAELRDLTSAERVVRVQQLARQSNRNPNRKLSPDDELVLRSAVTKFVDGHKPELLEELRRNKPEVYKQVDEHPNMANMMVMWRAVWDEGSREEFETAVKQDLSEPTRSYLASLTPDGQANQLRSWVRSAMNPKIGPQELEQFFTEKLSNDQREKLLNMQQSDMETQLERWYMAAQMGIPEQQWGTFDLQGRPGRGGPGFGRPARDREEGPRGRGEGPPREFGGRRFDRGPDGPPPDGRPPGGPPREGRPRRGTQPDDQDREQPPGPPPR